MTSASPVSELFSHSPSLEQQIRGAERAARTDVPVLILGEPLKELHDHEGVLLVRREIKAPSE